MNRRRFFQSLAGFGALCATAKALPVVQAAAAPRVPGDVRGATRAAVVTVSGYGPWKIVHGLDATGLRVRGHGIGRHGPGTTPCRFRVKSIDGTAAELHLVEPARPPFLWRFLKAPTFAVTLYARQPNSMAMLPPRRLTAPTQTAPESVPA